MKIVKFLVFFCILYFDTIIFHIAKVGRTSRFDIYKFEFTFQR